MAAPAGRLLGTVTILILMAAACPWPPPRRALSAPLPFGPNVCVLSPRVEPDGDGLARAAVPVSAPTIFVRDPLARVRIVRGTVPLWQLEARPGEAIEGPIFWPLAPLRPHERLSLQLQPVGAAAAGFASIELEAAAAAVLARNDRLLASLDDAPSSWQAAINQAREERNLALTSALMFAYQGPSGGDLNALRLLVIERSCGGESTP